MSNEGRACHAVIKVLEERFGHSYSEADRPEQRAGVAPVELVVTIGAQRVALEHTIVEAFAGQLQADQDFGEFLGPIAAAFEQPLPFEGVFYLSFPIHTRVGRRNIAPVQAAIIDWVRTTAERFAEQEPHRRTRDHSPRGIRQREQREFAGMQVNLSRELHWSRSTRHDGRLTYARRASDDVEGNRRTRIGSALPRKLSKLQRWKADGARSILILEDNDIALSNEILISQAVSRCFEDESLRLAEPDEIYLVDTCTDSWGVFLVRQGLGPWLHEMEQHVFWEFAAKDLEDLTPRRRRAR